MVDNNKKLKFEFVNYLYENQKYDGAITKINEYLKEEPDNIEFIKKLKSIAFLTKNDKISFKALKRYIQIYPNSYSSRKRLKILAKKLGKKININSNSKSELYSYGNAEFMGHYEEINKEKKKLYNNINYIFKTQLIYKIKKNREILNYCNVKALEKLLNKLYMSNSEIKRLASYEALIENFQRTELSGIIILLKYKTDEKSEYDSQVILAKNGEKDEVNIKYDKYYYPVVPKYLILPRKIVYDNDIPLNPQFEDYDKDRIIERIDDLDKLYGRIEVGKIEIINEILERCNLINEEDLFKNMESINYLTLICGIKSEHLTIYINSIRNSLDDRYDVELLETMEKTYAFLSYIKKILDDKNHSLLIKLNKCKNDTERKKILKKYFKKDELIMKLIR
jgi:hypothetical protein